MYDGDSLCWLLLSGGFKDPGTLDLEERAPESVFVEAINP